MKKSSGLYQHEKRRGVKGKNIMKTHTTKAADSELAALAQLRDEDIDTSDIPEVTNWTKAVVGKFYRAMKEPVTLRLDVDVVSWLKSEGPGYQTRINSLLRAAMTRSTSKGETDLPLPARSKPQFPTLARRGELDKYCHVAKYFEKRGSIFAPAA